MRRFLLPELAAFFLLVFIYNAVARPLLEPIIQLPFLLRGLPLPLTLALFSLFHALYLLGWRHAMVFFALSLVISWSFEQVGVVTGLVYGKYHYTEVLGAKLSHVPLLIPVAWFMMLYPSHVMANLIGSGHPTTNPRGVAKMIGLSFLAASIMTAWDLAIDPIMSGPDIQAWVWEEGGSYFAIPFRNFLGWMLTAFTIALSYRLVDHSSKLHVGDATPLAFSAMPVIAYAAMMLAAVFADGMEILKFITLFAMGIPIVGAFIELVRKSD